MQFFTTYDKAIRFSYFENAFSTCLLSSNEKKVSSTAKVEKFIESVASGLCRNEEGRLHLTLLYLGCTFAMPRYVIGKLFFYDDGLFQAFFLTRFREGRRFVR